METCCNTWNDSAKQAPAARAMPRCDGVAIPLEDARILWQR
jgi:hypothetical protein